MRLALFSLVLILASNLQAQETQSRPNIIFIFADDWGYGDLSCHGSKFLETPNIDQLAKEGIDFSSFTVNNPVCSPSRTAVMTGQFPARQSIHQHFQSVRAHINRGMPDWLDVEGILLPREFQKAGYVTGHFGKWHLGSGEGMPTEDQYGYDEYATFNGSKTAEIPKSGSLAVEYVERFIKKHKDQPFFVNFWLHETHLNHYPKERFMEHFDDLNDKEQVYASVIAEGDEAVGRIMNLLKQLNIDKNTLVIFSSDNGPEWEGFEERFKLKGDGLGKYYSVGKTAGLKGSKRSLFEGGIRVPFIVRWPELVPQNVKDTTSVITAVDLLPTFLETAGIEISENYMLDGESALSAFKGETFKRSKPIFWEWRGGTKNEFTWPTLGVRDGDWKLVVDVSREKRALYHLPGDWGEKENLADRHPDKLKELSEMLEAWKQSLPTEPRVHCLSPARQKINSSKPKSSEPINWEQMNTSKAQAKEAFNDAKYGMFIHWGLYAIPGGIWEGKKMEELRGPSVAEWIQYGAEIPREEYAQLASEFNPVNYDADAIARLARDAGMKYVVITSKHHDGFAMYDSKVSEYDMMDASPYKKDIVQELYDACKKYGLDFGLYYSHNLDWMDGNDCGYNELLASGLPISDRAKRKAGLNTWDPSPNTFSEYLENKAYPQVEEILTKFPEMTTLWYDYGRYVTPEQSLKFYKMAYELQPDMLVNSRVGNELGDFDIPGDNKIPEDHLAITKPWQTVGTTNNSWGYKSYDDDWKSVKELIFWLTEIVSKGGNYMLNIGPDASGKVPQQSVDNLREVGLWLKVNGEAIYDTRKWDVTHEGPTSINMGGTHIRKAEGFNVEFTPQDFWFTQKGGDIYVIALEYPEAKVLINNLSTDAIGEIQSVQLLGSQKNIEWKQSSEGLEVIFGKTRTSAYGYALKIGLKE